MLWKENALTSLERKRIEKSAKPEVDKLISKRLFNRDTRTLSILDTNFTKEDEKKYTSKVQKQINNKDKEIEVQLPSTAIEKARYDNGFIYITYVGGDKEYVFKGDKKEFMKLMQAGSKGRYVQNVMRKYNTIY